MSAPTMPALALSLCLRCGLPWDDGCTCGQPSHVCDMFARPRCIGCDKCSWCGRIACVDRDHCQRRWLASETSQREMAAVGERRLARAAGVL